MTAPATKPLPLPRAVTLGLASFALTSLALTAQLILAHLGAGAAG